MTLGEILAGDADCGVHRLADASADDVRAEAAGAGWSTAYVDGATLTSRAAVMLAIGEALAFPAYFTGRSLDGLHDCLRDVSAPTVLVWDGWNALADSDPPALRRLLLVLAGRAANQPAFEVVLLGDGPEDAAPSLVE
ncbi:barstar family protein [Nocardioides montaniterrae]